MRLEMLIARDGLSFDQACETLRTNEAVGLDRPAFEEIVTRLPIRLDRVQVGEEALDELAQREAPLDARESTAARKASARRIRQAMARAIVSLPPQDRLILRLRFQEDLGVADIARALNLEQKPLYRRLDNLLGGLRSALEAAGVDREEARSVLEGRDLDVMVGLTDSQPDRASASVIEPPSD